MVGKSGQMKMQQTIFMLLALILFFILLGMFFLVINFSKLKHTANNLMMERSILLASKLANSPEFSCGNAFGEPKTSCIDLDKVMALKDLSENYTNFWGVDNIEIRRIYPTQDADKNCTEENYPRCGIIKIYNSPLEGVGVQDFVSLCRKTEKDSVVKNICQFGEVIIFKKNEK